MRLSNKNLKILKHNQVNIKNYNSKKFFLAPFPVEKLPLFNFDNLATTNTHFFLKDKKFIKSKLKAEKRWNLKNPRQISWRLHFILFYVYICLKTAKKKDIFLECGTGKGYMAAAICDYFKWDKNKPKFFLADSFLKYNASNNINQKKTNDIPFCYTSDSNEVEKYFRKYVNFEILKGFCPTILNKLPSKKKIIFCHIDLNSSVSELKTFQYLLKKKRFKKGAVVIFDDFGENKILAKNLIILLKKLKKEMLMSPTGQGLIII